MWAELAWAELVLGRVVPNSIGVGLENWLTHPCQNYPQVTEWEQSCGGGGGGGLFRAPDRFRLYWAFTQPEYPRLCRAVACIIDMHQLLRIYILSEIALIRVQRNRHTYSGIYHNTVLFASVLKHEHKVLLLAKWFHAT